MLADVYLLDTFFVGWVIVATVQELCKKKCDFYLKKRTKESFAYVLERMLTLA